MSSAYGLDEIEKRKLCFLYRHSGIEKRYSVIDDFSLPGDEWDFIPREKNVCYPSIDDRMKIYAEEAAPLSIKAIEDCIEGYINAGEITHLITVSCTGMSAPGLDLQIAEAMQLPVDIFRTSVNFMGCYAAVHALKLAKLICQAEAGANVVIVSTELCTIHFQNEYTPDNAASSLLFSDGSAAVLVSNKLVAKNSLLLKGFYSQVAYKGKNDMAWELSSKGFLMTLSGYIPQLIEEDITVLVDSALRHYNLKKKDITHWCVHPGGKKILEVIEKQLQLEKDDLCRSRKVLAEYGNMSSPTILFVLKDMMQHLPAKNANVMGIAFGPGLTMETFIAGTP
jgi:predicted naringenin-chalcone synthase